MFVLNVYFCRELKFVANLRFKLRFLLRNTGVDSDFTQNFWGKNWRLGALSWGLVVKHIGRDLKLNWTLEAEVLEGLEAEDMGLWLVEIQWSLLYPKIDLLRIKIVIYWNICNICQITDCWVKFECTDRYEGQEERVDQAMAPRTDWKWRGTSSGEKSRLEPIWRSIETGKCFGLLQAERVGHKWYIYKWLGKKENLLWCKVPTE